MTIRGVTQKTPLLPAWSDLTEDKYSQADKHPVRHRGHPLPSTQELAHVQQPPHGGPASAALPRTRRHSCTHTRVREPELSTQAAGSALPVYPQGSSPCHRRPPTSPRYGTSSRCQARTGVSACRNIGEQTRVFQLVLHLFCFPCFFSSPRSLFLTFPFLAGPSLRASPNFHKGRNCFQVGIKQTRSLEKIKNNEFLSERLLSPLPPLPPFQLTPEKEK